MSCIQELTLFMQYTLLLNPWLLVEMVLYNTQRFQQVSTLGCKKGRKPENGVSMISTFCLSSASKSVLSFQLLFLNLIGRFPTYLPSVKAEVRDYLLNIRVNLQFGSKEFFFFAKKQFFLRLKSYHSSP